MNVLVVAPHADDEVLGCGGLIARRKEAGHRVDVVVLGLGGVPQRADGQPSDVAMRQDELHRAGLILGVDRLTVLFPGLDMRMDTLPMLAVVTALDNVLDATRYDEVYLPYASSNQDHQVCYRAMLAALRPATGRSQPKLVAAYEYALIGWQPEAVPGGRLYVDISHVLDIKLAALDCYPSQLRPFPHPCSPEAVTTLARYRGLEAGLQAAELFYLLRRIERD